MKERPILMSGPLVREVLAGNKTQTRRPVKLSGKWDHVKNIEILGPDQDMPWHTNFRGLFPSKKWRTFYIKCPCGEPGDQLWVRETWQHTKCLNINPEDENYGYVYRADQQPWEDIEYWIWKPSTFMPREASRITLEIEDIRVERLHDISEDDAKAEGVQPAFVIPDQYSYKNAFYNKWVEIYGQESFNANPWVWVIKFKRLKP